MTSWSDRWIELKKICSYIPWYIFSLIERNGSRQGATQPTNISKNEIFLYFARKESLNCTWLLQTWSGKTRTELVAGGEPGVDRGRPSMEGRSYAAAVSSIHNSVHLVCCTELGKKQASRLPSRDVRIIPRNQLGVSLVTISGEGEMTSRNELLCTSHFPGRKSASKCGADYDVFIPENAKHSPLPHQSHHPLDQFSTR